MLFLFSNRRERNSVDHDETEALDESLEQLNQSDGERPSDVSNYNPSDSDPDSDDAVHEDLKNRCEDKKLKRLRFKDSLISIPVKGGFLLLLSFYGLFSSLFLGILILATNKQTIIEIQNWSNAHVDII